MKTSTRLIIAKAIQTQINELEQQIHTNKTYIEINGFIACSEIVELVKVQEAELNELYTSKEEIEAPIKEYYFIIGKKVTVFASDISEAWIKIEAEDYEEQELDTLLLSCNGVQA